MAPAVIEERPAAVLAAPVAGPYKGLANFTEEDAAFFFGREREREVIIANLRARRVTLLYGASGVGKTSLLRAGVVPELLALAQESVEDVGLPEFIPVVVSGWRDDPLLGLIEAIETAVQRFVPEPLRLPRLAGLAEAVQVATDATEAYLLVILDQFEEYFLYHGEETGPGTLVDELPRAIAQPDVQAGFLISIREDAVAKLDRLKARIPSLFDTFIRVEHLDPEAARAAILRPVEEHNARVAPEERVGVDPALIGAVLAQVRAGQVVLEQAGAGTVQRTGGIVRAGDRIETPYLQLVMARLWDEERQRHSQSLSLATLAALGGAQEIVRTHLDAALRNFSPEERYVVADLFHQLVTPSGTKIAHSAADLAEYVALSEAQVTQLLEKLARPDTRIVRAVAPPPGDPGPSRYEIFHDVLAPSILDWRSRQAASRRARALVRRRIVRLVAVLGAAIIALIVWLAISAFNARNQADISATRARSAQRKALLSAARAHAAQRQSVQVAGQLRVKSGQEARLAAKYNHQRFLERSLRRQADHNAVASEQSAARARALTALATNQEARANRLAGVNAGQAAHERVLARRARRNAAAARRSAAAARLSAAAARLSLSITHESVALAHIRPVLNETPCFEIHFMGRFYQWTLFPCVIFKRTVLTHVPASATVTVWAPPTNYSDGFPARRTSVRGTRPQNVTVSRLSRGHRVDWNLRIYFLVTLRDLGWLNVIQTHKPRLINPKLSVLGPDIRIVELRQCTPSGSRATGADAPAVCPSPPHG